MTDTSLDGYILWHAMQLDDMDAGLVDFVTLEAELPQVWLLKRAAKDLGCDVETMLAALVHRKAVEVLREKLPCR